METSIHVYGNHGIKGDKFVARTKTVEGRKVIVLEAVRGGSVRGNPL